MAEKGTRPVNKRLELMRNQIKNTLFEATAENSSPKILKEDIFFQTESQQSVRSLTQKDDQLTQEQIPSFEQGKWLKMSNITQKRNFEMMRANLKVQMFGKDDRQNDQLYQQKDSIEGDFMKDDKPEAKEKAAREAGSLDICVPETTNSLHCMRRDLQEISDKQLETQMVLHSLIPCKKNSDEGKTEAMRHMPDFSSGTEIEDVTLRTQSIFRKFSAKAEENDFIYEIENTFCELYDEMETLGEGTSGIVKRCVKISNCEEFAVKIINFKGDEEIKALVVREFKNHRRLKHKNIVSVYELYIDNLKNKIYMVMELVKCRELFDVIQELGSFCEADASMIFKQILLAIQYLHSNGVCHRDLKPNNILASNDGKIVKIIDFNVSKFIDKTKKQYTGLSKENYKMWTYTGTIAFTAPEVLADTEYTEMVDVWSAGCVLYTMLCGYQPFQAEYRKDLIDKIIVGSVEYKSATWDQISPGAIDLLQKLLEKDHKKRQSPSQALSHAWICNVGKLPKQRISGICNNLRDNATRNSRAACLAARVIKSSLLPRSRKGSKNLGEQQVEDNKSAELDDDDFPGINFSKFISEQPAREFQDKF